MRGAGLHHLSPTMTRCGGSTCEDVHVGARSLIEVQSEFRWLPYRKQVGATLWADIGAAGLNEDPFEEGVTAAVGVGLRVRTWHLPLSLDLGMRVTEVEGTPWHELLRFFVRIGEAF